MERDVLEKKLRAMRAAKGSFTVEPAPPGKFKLAKRLGRKLTYWYVAPFGETQNQFNTASAELIEALYQRVEAFEGEIAVVRAECKQRIADFRKETRQTLARTHTQEQAAIGAVSAELERSLCIAAPESRSGVGEPPLTKLPVIGTELLFQSFHAVQKANSEEETETALENLSAAYRRALSESMERLTDPKLMKPIAIVCNAFGSGMRIEAIRNEIWDLYLLLRDSCRHPVYIVSIEQAGGETSVSGDVHYVPDDLLGGWMRQYDPALLIFCESTTAILTAGDQCMLLRNAVLRLSGQNPAQALGGSKMQELLHLCDFGVQHYCIASNRAADIMEQHGFRRPAVMYPYIDIKKPMFTRRPRALDPERMTVGFASSPMGTEQTDARGIPALCELVQQNPDIRFLVLWRDADAVPVPEILRSAENCEIRTGSCDMTAFYGEIDCVLIPYAEENYNHACSLSAVEGMLLGIPTVATPCAGVSELIDACGIGLVAEGNDAAALAKALRLLPKYASAFQEPWRTEKLRDLLSGKEFVRYVEDCIAEAMPQGVHTLYEWDRQLKLRNLHLIKGTAPLRAYYQRQDVAANYEETRFSSYPQNCFDLMERQSVSVLLEHLLRGRRNPQLLDLASGTGRILHELLSYGDCTACDASPAMLRLLESQYSNVDIRQLDLLSDEIGGTYDAVTIFRFIRHYEYGTRKMLWTKLRNLIGENGVLLFDVPNARFEIPHRQSNGWGQYQIYDIFWTRRAIEKELADNGLRLAALVPIGQGLYPMPAEFRNEPMTWTAAAVRIPE